MNATQPGDTVLVPPGAYNELMTAPAHELHLLSHYAFSQDSSDIVETVLDGELQGTILTLPEGEYLFELNGFTVIRGLGSGEYPYPGGGVWAQAGIHLRLFNSVFMRNDTNGLNGLGSSVSAYHSDPISSLEMANMHFENNNNEQNPEPSRGAGSFFVSCEGVATLRKIVCNGAGQNDAFIYVYTADSLSVDSIRVENFLNTEHDVVKLQSGGNAKASRIEIRNNRSAGIGLFGVSAGHLSQGKLVINGLSIEQNYDSFLVSGMDISRAFAQLSADFIHAQDVSVRNNRQLVGYSLAMRADIDGSIQNLHVHDNIAGSDSTVQDHNMGRHIWLENMSLYDAEFWQNTSLMPAGGDGLGWTDSPLVYGYYGTSEEADTLVWENCSFRNNFVVNHMPQSTLRRGLKGRTVFLRGLYYGNLVIRNSEWVNNRVSRIAPEVDLWPGPRNVGSTIELEGANLEHPGTNVLVEDCVFADNDDGGVLISEPGHSLIQRCSFNRIDRFGLKLLSNRDHATTHIRNVNFHEIRMQEYYLPEPRYQGVVWIQSDLGAIVENISVSSCSTSFLVSLGYDSDSLSQVISSLFYNNAFDQFVIDTENTQAGEFSYCLAPFEIPGEDNIIGSALFDSQLGAPYLAPTSLGIDEGDPDPANNDIQDPFAPGWALWPSQGSLRNDVGFTGGPFAATLDTNWVSVSPESVDHKPQSFVIGEPYPNPFNPVTTVPVVLEKPRDLRISVFNILGQEVASLFDGVLPSGTHHLRLDGSGLTSGVYLVSIEDESKMAVRKVLLLR